MFDLLIKNAKSINDENIHISIHAGKIKKVSYELEDETMFNSVIDIHHQYYVSAGWIDMHTHCFDKFDVYSDDPDAIGYMSGVTTVVDAGTAGYDDIAEFYKGSLKSKTNVFSLLNISKIGLLKQDELSNIDNVDVEFIKQAVEDYKEFIVGLKIRLSRTVVGETNIEGLNIGKKVAKQLNLPVMIHIGSEPPLLSDILTNLNAGDIVTHIFNGKPNGILDQNDFIKNEVWDAKANNIVFDLGHGTDSFNFHVAEMALSKGLKVNTISSDIYSKNRINGPVYSLVETMNKMLYIGYSLKEVIEMVTANVEKALLLPKKGQLEIGYDADLTFFDMRSSHRVVKDSQGEVRQLTQEIVPCAVVIDGEWIQIEE